VIFNHKIYHRINNFVATAYNGASGHETHVHVSVGNGPDGRSTYGYDSTTTWNIDDIGSTPTEPTKPTKPSKPTTSWTDKLMADLPQLKNGSKGLPVNRLQALLNVAGAGVKEDGHFGPRTENAVRRFQDHANLSVDGIVGKNTWTKLVKG
jgi:peptidoglycan hydrolase-like protein with peptidoglycan-binding domain